jgi:hypothetical protein
MNGEKLQVDVTYVKARKSSDRQTDWARGNGRTPILPPSGLRSRNDVEK